jgi:hypothetical protein
MNIPLKESTRRLNEHERRMRELEMAVGALCMMSIDNDPVDLVARLRREVALRDFLRRLAELADKELAEAEL